MNNRLPNTLFCSIYREGERGASILVPALTEENKRIEEFLVDLTLPMHLFEALFRCVRALPSLSIPLENEEF
jgi:hypothetical protein